VRQSLLAGLLLGVTVTGSLVGPAGAGTLAQAPAPSLPVRWITGAAVWSTSPAALATFISTGMVTDRGLQGALLRSGWTAEELRVALAKVYEVNLVAVDRFLASPAGLAFLRTATTSYVPDRSLRVAAVQALRSAILRDARDGRLSAAGILDQLPTDFRLAETGGSFRGIQPLCAPDQCQEGTPQCTSLLSWVVFLPACLQALQRPDPLSR